MRNSGQSGGFANGGGRQPEVPDASRQREIAANDNNINEEQIKQGFTRLMQMIAWMDEDVLFSYVRGKYLALPDELRRKLSAFYCENESWGRLYPWDRDFSVFHNRTHEIKDHFAEFLWLFEQMSDIKSKAVLFAVLNNWVNMDFSTLEKVCERNELFCFDKSLVKCTPKEVFVDVGSFEGDSIIGFADVFGRYERIYGYEANPEAAQKLKNNVERLPNVEVCCKAVSGAPDRIIAKTSDGIEKTEVEVVCLDDDIKEAVTYVKIDIGGGEREVLRGCSRHITIEHPKLAVSNYYSNRDLWEIPRIIKDMDSEYKLYMRYNGGSFIPTEYVLFAL